MFSRINNPQAMFNAGPTQHGVGLGQSPPSLPSVRGWPVTVSVEGIGFSYQLTNDDLFKVFSRYGNVTHVEVILPEGNSATVFFAGYDEASRAIASLDSKELAGVKGHLRVGWGQLPTLPPGAQFDNRVSGEPQRKFTCRFEVGIENDKEFQVARRIIGQKGINMKEIVARTDAKLRLRGRGSGYLEGLTKTESPEPLHLCVSCTTRRGYTEAARLVTELLEKIYSEYKQYCESRGLSVDRNLKVTIREHPLGSGPYPSLDVPEIPSFGHIKQTYSAFPTAPSSPLRGAFNPPEGL